MRFADSGRAGRSRAPIVVGWFRNRPHGQNRVPFGLGGVQGR